MLEAEEKGEQPYCVHLIVGTLGRNFQVLYWLNILCFSEFLLVHLRHPAAAVPGHLSFNWIYHGLEDEGMQRGEASPDRY